MNKFLLPYSRQSISTDDINSVIKTLKSEILSRGSQIEKFEKNLKKYVGSKYALTTTSATSSLHLSCLAIGLKERDLVWTVPNTFVATANCILYCNSKIDFVDIDYNTGNIDVEKLKDKLANSIQKPKAIITVDFAGQPTDQEQIYKLSKKYRFYVIEDASHALGAKRKNELVGSCKWSDLTIFSFHPVKTITTGEGGAITTNNKKIYDKIKILRNHGITKDLKKMKIKNNQKWYYEQIDLGYNYWMSDLNACLGISQLKKVEKFVQKRNKIAKFYFSELKDLPIILPEIKKVNRSSFHLFVIKILKKNKNKYKEIFNELLKKGLGVNLHYLAVHLQPYYKRLGFKKGSFPKSELHAETAISIPIYYDLSLADLKKIVRIIKSVIKKYVF